MLAHFYMRQGLATLTVLPRAGPQTSPEDAGFTVLARSEFSGVLEELGRVDGTAAEKENAAKDQEQQKPEL